MYTANLFSFLQADLSSYKDIDQHVLCQPFTNQHNISQSATVAMIENKNIFITVYYNVFSHPDIGMLLSHSNA